MVKPRMCRGFFSFITKYVIYCDILLVTIFRRRMIIINILLGIIGAIVLLAFVVHPGVPDKRVPLKNKLAVILPLIVIAG